MNQQHVETALIGVIQDIQAASGLECPPLDGTIVPTKQVPEFDSKVWVAATTMLATKLEVTIPDDQNIFVDDDSKSQLDLSAIAAKVCKVALTEKSSGAAA